MEYSQARMIKVVKRYLNGDLDGHKWNYDEVMDNVFTGEISNIGGKINNLKFAIIVNNDTVLCYHIAPLTVPEDQRAAVSEFISRVNYDMIYGNFELNFSNGELRHKTTISEYDLLYNDTAAIEKMIHLMVLGPSVWVRYGESLLKILFGFADELNIEALVAESENAE